MSDSTIEKNFKLKDLKATTKNQTREALNKEALADYKAHIMAAKDKGADPEFKPLVAYRDMSGDVFLSDGFHRRAALLGCDIETYEVEIRESDDAKRDAVANGFKANIAHGVRLTNADKLHNLNLALEDKEWAQLSHRGLADLIGVSESFVRTNRPKAPAKVKAKDGREMSTEKIGKQTGNTRDAKRAAKKAAKKGEKPKSQKAEEPKVDAALDKAYAKIGKALGEKGASTIEALKKGIILMPRADIIKLSMNSDARVREIGELVFTSRWSLKKAVKFLDKAVDAQSNLAELVSRALANGGIFRTRFGPDKAQVIMVLDSYGTIGETKEGVTTITPKK